MRRPLLGFIVCSILVAPSLGLAQISADDVVASMDNEQFQQALGSCFTGDDDPEQLTLTLVVGPQGGASLMEAPEGLSDDQYGCATLATAHLEFPATGSSFAITVTVPVIEVEAPPEKKPFEIKTVTHPPTTPPAALVVPATVVVVEDDSWRLEYSKGKKKFIGGIVTMAAGFQVLLVPGIALLVTVPIMCDPALTGYEGYLVCRTWLGAGIALGLLGALAVSIGIALISKGKKIKKKALAKKPLISLGPTHDASGATLRFSWQF